jgi:carboxylesterase type B
VNGTDFRPAKVYSNEVHHCILPSARVKIAPLPWIGAARTVEQPLITGQHDQYRGESTDFEKDVSLAMQELWLSFARDVTQDPTSTSSDFTWPEFAITGDTVAVFAEDGQAVQLKDSAEVGPVCEF